MHRFWRLPLRLFVIGAVVQAATLPLCYLTTLSEPLIRLTAWEFGPSWLTGHAVVYALPIRHSHFGYNVIEARILDVTMVLSFGAQVALVSIIVETGRHLKNSWLGAAANAGN
jgi:hypothetical protein